MLELPSDENQPDVKTIPKELVEEQDRWAVQADAYTNLIYYEITSLVSMLRQLDIKIDPSSEIYYLKKIRDRFLSHVQLSGIIPGSRAGWIIPAKGLLHVDVVSLSSWSHEDLLMLAERGLETGTPEWETQRQLNENLVRSSTSNEHFTQDERINILAVGVRECRLELALTQFGDLLNTHLLPIIRQVTDKAICDFSYERLPD